MTGEYHIPSPARSSWGGLMYLMISSVGITGLLVLAYRFVFHTPRRLPPGPRGWPLIGNLLDFGRRPHQSLMKLSQKYGPLMFLKMGPIPTVVASSPEMAKEFLKTQDHLFASRPQLIFGDVFLMSSDDLILAPLGNNFRLLRKICMMEIFSPKRIADFEDVRKDEIGGLVERIVSDGREGKVVQLSSKFSELSFCTIVRVLFGKDFNTADLNVKSTGTRGKRLGHLVHQSSQIFIEFLPGDVFSWLRRLDWGGWEARLVQLRTEVVKFLMPIIDEHRKTFDNTQLKDFVDVLLSLQSKDEKDGLSDEKIVALLQDLTLAGIDTTAGQLTWVFTELMRNPDARKKLQSELDSVVGKTRLVEESDLVQLPYLQAVLKETMRLHPLLPLLLPHESLKDTTVGGYHIPEKTRVLVNVYAIARDPNLWENPLSFDPSRFLNRSIDVKGQDFDLLPFGSGRRICPGMGFALLSVQLAIAQILHRCDLSLPRGMSPQDVDVEELPGLTVTRVNPLPVLVTPRVQSPLYNVDRNT